MPSRNTLMCSKYILYILFNINSLTGAQLNMNHIRFVSIYKWLWMLILCQMYHSMYLSEALPGRICVTVRGRHFAGSSWSPPRNVNPNVSESRRRQTSILLHITENVVWAEIEKIYRFIGSSCRSYVHDVGKKLAMRTILVTRLFICCIQSYFMC